MEGSSPHPADAAAVDDDNDDDNDDDDGPDAELLPLPPGSRAKPKAARHMAQHEDAVVPWMDQRCATPQSHVQVGQNG